MRQNAELGERGYVSTECGPAAKFRKTLIQINVGARSSAFCQEAVAPYRVIWLQSAAGEKDDEQLRSNRVRILIIEDNERLAAFIAAGLTAGGFGVDTSHSIEEADTALRVLRYDALVLDLGLPDGDGLGFLRALRGTGDATPVLILTARDELRDRIVGLDTGADDYLVKPFALEELGARLRALLRRPGAILGRSLEYGNLVLDTLDRTLTIGDRPVALSRREFEVLEHLMRRAGNVVSKRLLEDSLYGLGEDSSPNAIEVLVSRLRRRLQTLQSSVSIHTMRGIGYLLMESKS